MRVNALVLEYCMKGNQNFHTRNKSKIYPPPSCYIHCNTSL